jgi:hypothetical protein
MAAFRTRLRLQDLDVNQIALYRTTTTSPSVIHVLEFVLDYRLHPLGGELSNCADFAGFDV